MGNTDIAKFRKNTCSFESISVYFQLWFCRVIGTGHRQRLQPLAFWRVNLLRQSEEISTRASRSTSRADWLDSSCFLSAARSSSSHYSSTGLRSGDCVGHSMTHTIPADCFFPKYISHSLELCFCVIAEGGNWLQSNAIHRVPWHCKTE